MWFSEKSYFSNVKTGFRVKEKLHEQRSKFQLIEVWQTAGIGKLLTLDGKMMVSEIDEFVYHEVMAHIPYMCLEKVRKVLVIGGGDGGVVREFTKHQDIEQIDLVEIDDQVVEVSRKYFPQCTQGLDDPRVTVHACDGIEFIKQAKNIYDIIVIDSTDPEDFASGLFTDEFYRNVHSALTENGIMMNQTENPFLDEFGIRKIYDNMRKTFPVVRSFSAPMLIYPGVFWTFGFSSKNARPTQLRNEKRNSMFKLQKNLKWYNMDWHQGAFKISNIHKKITGIED